MSEYDIQRTCMHYQSSTRMYALPLINAYVCVNCHNIRRRIYVTCLIPVYTYPQFLFFTSFEECYKNTHNVQTMGHYVTLPKSHIIESTLLNKNSALLLSIYLIQVRFSLLLPIYLILGSYGISSM